MDKQNKSVLYIAFHYPPILGSSGVLRSLAFTRHLAECNWHTRVITASLKSYNSWSNEQLSMLPENVQVIRAFARNTSKSFSFYGKYLRLMAQPDNWQSWIVGGFFSGVKAILKRRPQVIVSTYPIASAHFIAYLLHKVSGIAWVADFRDPMAQDGYPAHKTTWRIYAWIEKKAVKHCRHIIVTTPGTKRLYQQRFPLADKHLFQLIENGYDAVAFSKLTSTESLNDKTVLLHSGVIYPSERDPAKFFAAIAALKRAGKISHDRLEIRLRATGHDSLFAPILEELDIADIVKLLPIVSYTQALEEMISVDGLILLQAQNCNLQIPAKLYEYIKVGKPILGLMPADGDTGTLLQTIENSYIAALDDAMAIEQTLECYLTFIDEGTWQANQSTEQYSRQFQAKKFEALLSKVIETE